MFNFFNKPEDVLSTLLKNNYLADKKLAVTVFLSVKMRKPLLVEGPSGVGKTFLARALAGATGAQLLRLQCYPGLDESKALYEWNYHKQLLYLQTAREKTSWEEARAGMYTSEFLLSRPILKAFMSPEPVVLLIDEMDKSDDELESFLLEALSEFQVSIPELGTVKSENIPLVVITSNNSRDFSDALKRRCLHLHIPFPDREREEAIIRMNIKTISPALAVQIATFLSRVRKMALRKLPGISEAIDWARSLMALNIDNLDHQSVSLTLNALLKYEEDVTGVEVRLDDIIPESASILKPEGELSGDGHGTELDKLSRFEF